MFFCRQLHDLLTTELSVNVSLCLGEFRIHLLWLSILELPGPSRRLAPVIKCNAFLCFQSYIVRDISLTEICR